MVPFVVGLAFLSLGLLLMVRAVSIIHNGGESCNWPTVPGRIEKSHVRRHATSAPSYDVRLQFTYSVGGKDHLGIRPFVYALTTKEEAERVVASFPVGMVTPVYYKPSNPKFAVLVPGPAKEKRFHEMIIASIGIGIGGILVVTNWTAAISVVQEYLSK